MKHFILPKKLNDKYIVYVYDKVNNYFFTAYAFRCNIKGELGVCCEERINFYGYIKVVQNNKRVDVCEYRDYIFAVSRNVIIDYLNKIVGAAIRDFDKNHEGRDKC